MDNTSYHTVDNLNIFDPFCQRAKYHGNPRFDILEKHEHEYVMLSMTLHLVNFNKTFL